MGPCRGQRTGLARAVACMAAIVVSTVALPMATAFGADGGGSSAAPRVGRLFVNTNGADGYVQLDLRSGRLTPLPTSPLSRRRGPDAWQGNATGSAFVRVDPYGSLAFLEGKGFSMIGQADLSPFAGSGNKPRFASGVRLSPDGQLVMGYLWPSENARQPKLFVNTLRGRQVDGDSPLDYNRANYDNATDWLPDGRYVYLAGPELVIAKPGGGIQQRVPLRLPSGIAAAGGELRASPDGRRVLLTLNTPLGRANFRSLYTAELTDGVVRPLMLPSAGVVQLGVSQNVMGATWSPDGRWVAFLTRGVNAATGAGSAMPMCQSVRVVPVDGSTSRVDYDRADSFAMPDPRTPTRPLLGCASNELNWLP